MIKYIMLGIIQGLTEFLPVSSSGHLVIAQKLFGISGHELTISVFLHLGTSLALVVFLFQDIVRLFRDLRTLVQIAVVTAITGFFGIAGKDFFSQLFSSSQSVAVSLIFTGAILILTKNFIAGKRIHLYIRDAVVLGLAQSAAIVPGISRSGTTICALLFRGIEREKAFKFSMLASLPALFGAIILEGKDISMMAKPQDLAAGFLASLAVGLLSLFILKLMVQKAKLYYFGYYCIIVAVSIILFIK